MTVKELRKEYKDYMILLFGRPLSEPTTPYTLLPKGKDIDECVVAECDVKEKPHEAISLGLDLRKRGVVKYKGTVWAYIK